MGQCSTSRRSNSFCIWRLALPRNDGKGLFRRNLAVGFVMRPRLLEREYSAADQAFTQPHRVRRQIPVGEDFDNSPAYDVIPHIEQHRPPTRELAPRGRQP